MRLLDTPWIQKIRDKYDQNFLLGDLLVAWGASGVVYLVVNSYDLNEEIMRRLEVNSGSVYSTLASIAGALLGFILTTIGIIGSYSAHPLMRPMLRNPAYKSIGSVFKSAIFWSMIVVVVSIVGLMQQNERQPSAVREAFDTCQPAMKWLWPLTLVVVITCAARVVRSIRVMLLIMEITQSQMSPDDTE